MSSAKQYAHSAVKEIDEVIDNLKEAELDSASKILIEHKRIFFSGMGRSGDIAKALCIRYMHLGFEAYVAGEAATPSISNNDLLIAITSSAKTKVTLNHIEVAKKNGATVILLTSNEDARDIADQCIMIPAKTKVKSNQHAGTLFEQSVLIIGDALAKEIQATCNITTEYMNKRHANLQ